MLTSDQPSVPSVVWGCILGIEFVPDGKFTFQEWKGSPAMKRQDDTPMYLEGMQKNKSIIIHLSKDTPHRDADLLDVLWAIQIELHCARNGIATPKPGHSRLILQRFRIPRYCDACM